MNAKDYRKLTLKQMQTRKWKLANAVTLRSGTVVPRGTKVTIIGKHGGLNLRTEKCPHCGIQQGMQKIHFYEVEEIR